MCKVILGNKSRQRSMEEVQNTFALSVCHAIHSVCLDSGGKFKKSIAVCVRFLLLASFSKHHFSQTQDLHRLNVLSLSK